MDLVLLFLFLYFVAQLVVAVHHHNRQQKIKEEIGNSLAKVEEMMKEYKILRVEEYDNSGMFYVYDQITDDFVCQGKSLEEIVKTYRERFPGKKAFIDQGHELLFKEEANV